MTSFPSPLPADTETLEIRGSYSQRSQFHQLAESDLSGVKSLKVLVITHTLLDSIDKDAFKELRLLTSMDLSFNRLTSLPSGVFDGLSTLSMLHLSGNEHLNLPADVFKGPHSLIELYLSDLALSDLDLDLLHGLDNLLYLDLSHNELRLLPSGIADRSFLRNLRTLDLSFNRLIFFSNDSAPLLSRVATVWLSDNPWQCNCELSWLLDPKYRSHTLPAHVPSERIPVCDGPEELSNMPWTILKPEQLPCTPAKIDSCNQVDPQFEGDTFEVECSMSGQPFPFVSWKTADGSSTTGSSREHVVPELDLQPPKVTITFTASKATNGTLTVMAQNVYGSGTKKIDVLVKPLQTTTTTTTTVSTAAEKDGHKKTTANNPTEDKDKGKDEDKKDEEEEEEKKDEAGGNMMMIYVAAGAGGVVLLLVAILVYVACRKVNKNAVKPFQPEKDDPEDPRKKPSNNRHNTDKHTKDYDNDHHDDGPSDYGVEKINYGRVNLGEEGGGYRPHHPTTPCPPGIYKRMQWML